ncbi:hypothetical protein OOK39_46025 [Streptomyces sp. NBC_00264]|nr:MULTISPECIES: hypothetical protein [unclassified Streptomyces]MCX5166376.1 hypothetical protein [Streptomyces sp. NBC_00305]MCX5166397.1 hypothetical protein [Streptomyces sp. NBC_00305]MCX5224894.1 hypothetical protein [Streptomyces sp. NBC_00264]
MIDLVVQVLRLVVLLVVLVVLVLVVLLGAGRENPPALWQRAAARRPCQ